MARRGREDVARLIGAVRRDRAGLLVTTALTAAVLAVVALPAHAQLAPDTQPMGGVVVAGSARIGATASTTTVTQSSPRAAVNWQSFNLGTAATVNFVQPSASAVTLNRVLAPDPSVIAGHIHANGGIVITNQAGVVFTHGAEVNAASVLVSAAGITNRNFMAGRMQFDIPAKPGARIVNAGHITVQAAGLAALVAPEVANSGVISAKLGHVILAGGAAAETLDLYGDGLVSLDVTPEAHQVRLANGTKATALVTNSGTIIASGGTVLLTASQTDGLVQDLVDAGGTIAANSVGAHAGTIAIAGIGGSIRIPGTLLAVGLAPGTTGGAIALNATGTVTVADGARINAAGGGTVAIGTTLARARGGPGTAATLTASAVTVAPRARIAADATESGNGGRVTVLSLGATRMEGAIEARGGPGGGNGGSVEISGENLSLDGGVDTAAPLGATGSILLDPYDLTIVPSGTSGTSDTTDVTASPVNGVAYDVSTTNDTVSAGAIEALTGNVTLQATNSLEIAANLNLGTGQALTLQAGNDLTVDSGFTVSTTAGNAITMDSAVSFGTTAGNPAGAITVNGTVAAGGALTLNAGTGGISISGSISGDGLSLSTGGAIVVGGTASAGAGDNLSLSAGAGGIIVSGSISGDAVALTTTGSAFGSSGAINATTLSGTTGNGASLTGPNNSIGTLATFDSHAGGTFNLADKSSLTVTGTVSVPSGSNLAIEAGPSLTIASGGSLAAPGGSVNLTAGASGIVIDGSIGGGTGSAPSLALSTTGPVNDASGSISATTLSGSSAGASLTGNNTIGALGNFTVSSGAFSLTNQEPLGITGAVAALGNSVTFTINGGGNIAEQTGGSITAGTLAGSAGSASFNEANTIGSLGDFTVSNGALSLTDQEPLNITGALAAAGHAVTFTINNGGSLLEQAGGSITAGTLAGSAGSASFNEANTIGSLDGFTASGGGFSLTEVTGQTLSVTGEVSVPTGQTIALTADAITIGAVLLAGLSTAPDGTVVLAPASTIPIALRKTGMARGRTLSLNHGELDLIAASTLQIGSGNAGPITISGAITLPASVALLDLVSSGAVTEATAADSLSVGTLEAEVASASLIGSNTIGTLGDITAHGGFALADTGSLTLIGLLDGGSSTVQLNDPGSAISEQGSGAIDAGILQGTLASATLDGANDIAEIAALTAPGGFSLKNDELLTIGGDADLGTVASFAITGGLLESGAGVLTAGTIEGNATNVSLPNGTNQIGTLGAFSAPDGFSLTEAAGWTLSVAGEVGVLPGATIALTIDGLQILSGGSLSASGGTVILAPASPNRSIALDPLGFVTAGALSINSADLGAISTATLEIGSETAGPITVGLAFPFSRFPIVVPNSVTSLVLESAGAISENGSLSAPRATLSGFAGGGTAAGAAGTASLANSNALASIGSFTALGGFTLATANGLAISGLVDTASAGIDLASGGSITELAGGTLVGGDLLGFAGGGALAGAAGTASLANANTLASLGDFTALGGFTLDNPAGLFVAGHLDAGNATVQLTSLGALIETTGSITAGLLEGTLASAALGGANKITDIAALTALGGLSLTNDERLTISGAADFGTAAGSFAITGGLAENGSGILSAGLIEGSATSVSLPNGANVIGTLGAFSAPGGLLLATANGLAISGLVDTGSAGIDLIPGGSIAEVAGGTLIGGELLGFAGGGALTGAAGTASFANTNTLASLGDFTALGGFTLADAGSLALLGALNAGSTNVVLTGGAAVTEPSGSITATMLSGTLASAALGGANRISDLGNFSAAGGFSLNDATALTLTLSGPVSAGSAGAAFTLGGSLDQSTAGSLTAGTLAASATLIDLTDPANGVASLGAITAPGGLTLATATGLTIAGTVATGTAPISLTAGGNIAEVVGGTLIGGALTGSASAASFANTNSIAELGIFTAPGGFTLDNGGDLPIAGPLDAGASTALLIAGGSLYETTATITGETTAGSITAGTLTGSAGIVTLVSARENRIANLGPFSSDAFNLNDGEALAVIGTVTGNPIGLTVTGNLALGSGAGNGVLSSTGAVFLIASGAVTEPAGAIDATILTGSAASVSLPGANLVPLLGPFTTEGPFLLNAAEPTLTVNGPLSATSASLATAGNLVLAGPVSANAVTLSAGGAISEAGGVISAGTLAGSATDATLTAANTIATLGAFIVSGTLLLADEASLAVAGPVTAAFFGITDPSGVSFTGATDAGTLSITAGGSITEPSGTVTAALLEGSASGLAQFGPDAPAGSASITTLGPFSVSTGTFTLTDSIPLTIIGPLNANDFAITAPGGITVTNASITTVGLPADQQSAALPARPGSYFDVTTPGGRFLELGRTTINPDGGPATVRIQLDPAGGLISFADLVAPTTTLILDTGAGTAIGTIDIGALMVLGNLGSATLSGTIANLSGVVASSKATISPFQSARYRLNSCPLMSVNCIFIAPMSVPEGNPLSGLAIVSGLPNQQDIDLLLPNVAAEDY